MAFQTRSKSLEALFLSFAVPLAGWQSLNTSCVVHRYLRVGIVLKPDGEDRFEAADSLVAEEVCLCVDEAIFFCLRPRFSTAATDSPTTWFLSERSLRWTILYQTLASQDAQRRHIDR